MTYDQVRTAHTRNLCSAFNPSKVHTHTAVNTDTHHEHTLSRGQPFMLRRPGSSWGFGALLKGVVLRMERVLDIHFPHLQFLLARDSNLQPFDYKSDSNHFATTSHWGYHKCLWYTSYIYTHINTFSTLFSTILYNLSYRNTNIPYILPKIIEGNYLKAHKWTVLQRFCFLFWQIKKKTFIFFIFVQWKSCNLVFWLFFLTFFFCILYCSLSNLL